jgi:hypothetical protein
VALCAVGLAACGGSSHPSSVNQANAASSAVTDTSVKNDLFSLLNNGLSPSDMAVLDSASFWQVSTCVHQDGNQYLCSVWKGSDSRTLNVTDDGTNISEQGVGKGE